MHHDMVVCAAEASLLCWFLFRQGTSLGASGGIAQRARHPDELNSDNSKWMIDIDYYLSQQVFF